MDTYFDSIPHDIRLFHRASTLASRLHHAQLRKDGITPYVSHLMRVPLILRHVFECNDAVTLAAGILHDAIEDTTADYDDIALATSPAVADIVATLSKDMRLPEPERERAYDQQLASAPWPVRLVKLADVYDNLCDSCLSGATVSVRDKAERAISLAGPEPELARAVASLRALLEKQPAQLRPASE